MKKYLPLWTTFVVLASFACGCTKSVNSPDLYNVIGEVTVDGEPVADGTLTFEPADGLGGVYGGRIEEGRYEFKAEPGDKKVSITAARPSKNLGPDGNPMFEQYLPGRYNANTELVAHVDAAGENRFDFELSTQK